MRTNFQLPPRRTLFGTGLGMVLACSAALASCIVLAWNVAAQEFIPPPPYDGLQAGQEAAAEGNARRAEAVGAQAELVEALRWRALAGRPPYAGQELWDTPAWPDPWAEAWAGPPAGTWDSPWSAPMWLPAPGWSGNWYAMPYYRVRQPVGRREVQTGPRRWESRPVYEQPPWPAQPAQPAPVSPPPAERGGPREF